VGGEKLNIKSYDGERLIFGGRVRSSDIDADDLTEGVYLITLQAINGERIVRKIIKQR